MTNTVHTEQRAGFTIRIEYDSPPQSPAYWDRAATIYTRKNRYFDLGEDMEGYEPEDGQEALPVYAYIHSGVRLSTGAFNCPWDSGQCGVIRMTRAKIIEEYGDDSESSREKARKLMRAEIEAWDQYYNGEVYGFIIEDAEGNRLDSCWGFYGDYESEGGALSEGRAMLNHHIEEARKERTERLKTMIRKRVPLEVRAIKLSPQA